MGECKLFSIIRTINGGCLLLYTCFSLLTDCLFLNSRHEATLQGNINSSDWAVRMPCADWQHHVWDGSELDLHSNVCHSTDQLDSASVVAKGSHQVLRESSTRWSNFDSHVACMADCP